MTATLSFLRLGNLDNIIYFITDEATRHTFVVDPAFDVDAILTHLHSNQMLLQGVLLTHSHGDHISALLGLLKIHPVPTYVTREEFRLGRVRIKQPHYIAEGDTITLGETSIRVYETFGHTVGSICFHFDKALITGDTLFVDGCGRCNFYESNVEMMWDSLQRLKELPDQTTIYPGHDYGQRPSDTLGNQKKTNPYLLIDDKAFFMDFRMNLQAQYRSIPFSPSCAEEMQAIYRAHC
ncbi:MAG: MBL fold hydrolase [Gammaproteobacteria bacterium]|nr:MAG: MBL fold hydrolase [Gammaproteobacteria bacterium]